MLGNKVYQVVTTVLAWLLRFGVLLGLVFGIGGSKTGAQPGDQRFGPLGAGNIPTETESAVPARVPVEASFMAGESWQSYPIFGGEMTSIVVDPFNAQTVYVGTRDGGVFKTTDGGANWQPARGGLTYYPIRSLAADPSHAGTLYAGTDGNGVWKTTDGGAHWAFSGSGIDEDLIIFNIVFNPTNSSILYAGAAGGVALVAGHVYKSTNSGASWQVKDTGMPLLSNSMEVNGVVAITIDPVNANTLYAGTTYDGAFRTTNGGESWSAINTGLELLSNDPVNYKTFTALAIDTAHSSRLSALYGGEFFTYTVVPGVR